MIQPIMACPALYRVIKQELLVCGESCIPLFLLVVAERWCQYKKYRGGSSVFPESVALKSVFSFTFSDNPTPGAFSVLPRQRTRRCVCAVGKLPFLVLLY